MLITYEIPVNHPDVPLGFVYIQCEPTDLHHRMRMFAAMYPEMYRMPVHIERRVPYEGPEG